MRETGRETCCNSLKGLDFIAWRVGRKKAELQQDSVHRILFNRPRLRRETKH